MYCNLFAYHCFSAYSILCVKNFFVKISLFFPFFIPPASFYNP
jgi:hypothetical protein